MVIQNVLCPLHFFCREELIEIPLVPFSLHTKACLARLNHSRDLNAGVIFQFVDNF